MVIATVCLFSLCRITPAFIPPFVSIFSPPLWFCLSFFHLSSPSFFLSLSAPTFYNDYNDTFTSQITTCRDCQTLAETQCLSASLSKSLKIQADFILTGSGIIPRSNASIVSWRLEVKAPKQWTPIGQMRQRADQAKVWELGWRITGQQCSIYFWLWWNVPKSGLAFCEKRRALLFGQICYCDTRSNYPLATFGQTH